MRSLLKLSLWALCLSTVVHAAPAVTNRLAAGWNIMCGLTKSGAACWSTGDDFYRGELAAATPKKLVAPISIGVFGNKACAIDEGKLVCWGRDAWAKEKLPTNLVNPRQVGVGNYWGCVLDDNGVQCWADFHPYTTVPKLPGKPYALAVGTYHTCAAATGGIRCWGDKFWIDYEVPAHLQDVAPKKLVSGTHHSCIITPDDRVECWGKYGSTKSTALAAQVPADLGTVSALYAGHETTCAVNEQGLRCWGFETIKNPTGRFAKANIGEVTANDNMVCAFLKDSGRMECSQDGAEFSPLSIHEPLGKVSRLEVAGQSNCAWTERGTRCWGGSYRFLNKSWLGKVEANYSTKGFTSLHFITPAGDIVPKLTRKIPAHLRNIRELALAQFFSDDGCVLTDKGLECWGRVRPLGKDAVAEVNKENPRGITSGNDLFCYHGDDGMRCRCLDARMGKDMILRGCRGGVVDLPPHWQSAAQVGLGDNFMCVLTATGNVECDGWVFASKKVEVPKMAEKIEQLRVGRDHACALGKGKVHCWGANQEHQLEVPADMGYVTQLGVGTNHSCALSNKGVFCWGTSSSSQATVPSAVVF